MVPGRPQVGLGDEWNEDGGRNRNLGRRVDRSDVGMGLCLGDLVVVPTCRGGRGEDEDEDGQDQGWEEGGVGVHWGGGGGRGGVRGEGGEWR